MWRCGESQWRRWWVSFIIVLLFGLFNERLQQQNESNGGYFNYLKKKRSSIPGWFGWYVISFSLLQWKWKLDSIYRLYLLLSSHITTRWRRRNCHCRHGAWCIYHICSEIFRGDNVATLVKYNVDFNICNKLFKIAATFQQNIFVDRISLNSYLVAKHLDYSEAARNILGVYNNM